MNDLFHYGVHQQRTRKIPRPAINTTSHIPPTPPLTYPSYIHTPLTHHFSTISPQTTSTLSPTSNYLQTSCLINQYQPYIHTNIYKPPNQNCSNQPTPNKTNQYQTKLKQTLQPHNPTTTPLHHTPHTNHYHPSPPLQTITHQHIQNKYTYKTNKPNQQTKKPTKSTNQ